MPTNRRRISRERSAIPDRLTPGQIEHLVSGFNFFDKGFANEFECAPAWERHRDEILAMQGRHPHGFPYFTRPWAWWKFDATEMRRIIKGMWSSWNCAAHEMPQYESERDYLIRLSLLNQAERELLASNEKSIDK